MSSSKPFSVSFFVLFGLLLYTPLLVRGLVPVLLHGPVNVSVDFAVWVVFLVVSVAHFVSSWENSSRRKVRQVD